jgi:hypothetical protein
MQLWSASLLETPAKLALKKSALFLQDRRVDRNSEAANDNGCIGTHACLPEPLPIAPFGLMERKLLTRHSDLTYQAFLE